MYTYTHLDLRKGVRKTEGRKGRGGRPTNRGCPRHRLFLSSTFSQTHTQPHTHASLPMLFVNITVTEKRLHSQRVCLCVWERERERKKCVCVCVYVREREDFWTACQHATSFFLLATSSPTHHSSRRRTKYREKKIEEFFLGVRIMLHLDAHQQHT